MSTISSNINDGRQYLRFPSALDLRAAKPLKAALTEALARSLPVTLDASSVDRISTACVQILIGFVAAARTGSLAVTFHRPSPPFLSAFEKLGLAAVVGDWNWERGA